MKDQAWKHKPESPGIGLDDIILRQSVVTGIKFKLPEIPSLVPDFTEERQDICVNTDQQRLIQSFRRFYLCEYFASQPKESNFTEIVLVLMQGYYYTKMVLLEQRNGNIWLYLLLFLEIIVVPGKHLSYLLELTLGSISSWPERDSNPPFMDQLNTGPLRSKANFFKSIILMSFLCTYNTPGTL